jgi:hypothetical protein
MCTSKAATGWVLWGNEQYSDVVSVDHNRRHSVLNIGNRSKQFAVSSSRSGGKTNPNLTEARRC